MALILTHEGAEDMLTILRDWFESIPVQIGLFTNDFTPTEETVLTDLVEADFPDYARLDLDNWGDPVPFATGSRITHNTQSVWTKGVGAPTNQVYGYFVTDGAGRLLWAERHPSAPRPMVGTGDVFRMQARYTYKSEF